LTGILRVEVPSYELDGDSDPAWHANFCPHAYLHPDRNWLLYIGKADYQTLRQRIHGDHKADLFDYAQYKPHRAISVALKMFISDYTQNPLEREPLSSVRAVGPRCRVRYAKLYPYGFFFPKIPPRP
jgi:hypothetical protein